MAAILEQRLQHQERLWADWVGSDLQSVVVVESKSRLYNFMVENKAALSFNVQRILDHEHTVTKGAGPRATPSVCVGPLFPEQLEEMRKHALAQVQAQHAASQGGAAAVATPAAAPAAARTPAPAPASQIQPTAAARGPAASINTYDSPRPLAPAPVAGPSPSRSATQAGTPSFPDGLVPISSPVFELLLKNHVKLGIPPKTMIPRKVGGRLVVGPISENHISAVKGGGVPAASVHQQPAAVHQMRPPATARSAQAPSRGASSYVPPSVSPPAPNPAPAASSSTNMAASNSGGQYRAASQPPRDQQTVAAVPAATSRSTAAPPPQSAAPLSQSPSFSQQPTPITQAAAPRQAGQSSVPPVPVNTPERNAPAAKSAAEPAKPAAVGAPAAAKPWSMNIPPLRAVNTTTRPVATTTATGGQQATSSASGVSRPKTNSTIDEWQRKLDAMEEESLVDIENASKELQNISNSLKSLSGPAPAAVAAQQNTVSSALSLKPFSLKKKTSEPQAAPQTVSAPSPAAHPTSNSLSASQLAAAQSAARSGR